MKDKKIVFFVGTTAEYIKIAPIIKELNSRKIKFDVIPSGQNKINFDDYQDFTGSVKNIYPFPEKPKKSSLVYFFYWALSTFTRGLFSLRRKYKGMNVYFIVHGDTVTSLIGSIIAKANGYKLVHVESGLRSFSFFEPVPEEIIRYIIIHIADVLLAPTDWALNNLKGLSDKRISTKENTLIESDFWALDKKEGKEYAKTFGKYYLIIIHRQENVLIKKNWAKENIEFILKNSPKDLNCVFVMFSVSSRYLDTERLNNIHSIRKRLFIVPKLPFGTFITLLNNAQFIATDSCTNQEEAYYLGTPYLALRNRTERVEGLKKNVVLAKNSKRKIKLFLNNYVKYKRGKVKLKEKPSKIIVDYLAELAN